ncbi:hypothetical protein AAMO2058_000658900 [Amorphochlora amoebiformis]
MLTTKEWNFMLKTTDVEIIQSVVAEAKKAGLFPLLRSNDSLRVFESVCKDALEGNLTSQVEYRKRLVEIFGDHSPLPGSNIDRKPPGPDIRVLLSRLISDSQSTRHVLKVPCTPLSAMHAKRLAGVLGVGYAEEVIADASELIQRLVSGSYPHTTVDTAKVKGVRVSTMPGKDPLYDDVCKIMRRLALVFKITLSLLRSPYTSEDMDSLALRSSANTTVSLLVSLMSAHSNIRTSNLSAPDLPTPPSLQSLWEVLQADVIHSAINSSILPDSLRQPPSSLIPFLKAASLAQRGTQRGAKHGGVVSQGGKVIAEGWNHCMMQDDGIGKMARKVVHAEVHCLLALENMYGGRGGGFREVAGNGTLWIVEPSEDGSGYEWAHPCPSCTQALTQVGVTSVRYSSPAGVRGESFVVNPNSVIVAQPYENARVEMRIRSWKGLGLERRPS